MGSFSYGLLAACAVALAACGSADSSPGFGAAGTPRTSSSSGPGSTAGSDSGTSAGAASGSSSGSTPIASADSGSSSSGSGSGAGSTTGSNSSGSSSGSTSGSIDDAGIAVPPGGTPVGVHGQLRVAGNQIVDKNGNPVVLHGMSMYPWNQQGLQFYNASAVGHLAKDWGCAALRIPILPSKVASQTASVKAVVDACLANGIYAIIDWHSMAGAQASAASAFFASMATAYGNTPNVMYEPWNEPVTESWATIKAYHETVIAAIRAIDPDNLIILGNQQYDQRPDLAAADPVTDSPNIAYSFHFYASSHRLASFGKNVMGALSKGVAIFVTEYGTCQASGNGTFDPVETQNWWSFLATNKISCTNWSIETNGETAAVFNRTGTSPTGPWTAADLTASGALVSNYIMNNP